MVNLASPAIAETWSASLKVKACHGHDRRCAEMADQPVVIDMHLQAAAGETRVASRQNAAAPVACHLKWFSANAYLALGYAAPRSIPIVYLQLISDVHRDWIAQKADRAEPVIAGVHEGGAC